MGLKEKNNKNKNEEDARSEFGGERLLVWFELIGKKGWTVGRCSLLSACSKTGLLYRNLALFYEKPPKSRLARGL